MTGSAEVAELPIEKLRGRTIRGFYLRRPHRIQLSLSERRLNLGRGHNISAPSSIRIRSHRQKYAFECSEAPESADLRGRGRQLSHAP